ncbi:uncharacterized protein LOC143203956 [Rhynchophorus ferrugineus]|uniref:uncharacterized protein LOC143203956 n=1 Tax=Rhynchophorus ferrugineus TaxID=354439 RepID=UPI003FCD3815
MCEPQVQTAVAQCIVIRFFVWEGVKETEIILRLRNQFGSGCLSRADVIKWAKAFKDGRETVKNEPQDRQSNQHHTPRRTVGLIFRTFRLNSASVLVYNIEIRMGGTVTPPNQSGCITLQLPHVSTSERSPQRSKIQHRRRGRGVQVAQEILRYRHQKTSGKMGKMRN